LVSLVFVDPFFMKIRIFSTLHNKRLSIKFSNRCWSCTYQGKPSNRNKIHFLHQMLLLEINQMDLQSSILCSGWKNDESTFYDILHATFFCQFSKTSFCFCRAVSFSFLLKYRILHKKIYMK
jgi:hypothetical protein